MVPLLLLWMLPAGLGLMLAGSVSAQVFTTLYSFTGPFVGGYKPSASLILSGNTLYGTALVGGSGRYSTAGGEVFAVNTDGTGFTNWQGNGVPLSGLILSGNTLYGTVYGGWGVLLEGKWVFVNKVFAVNTDFTGLTNLYTFTTPVLDNDTNSPSYDSYTNIDGLQTQAGLIVSGNTLYGTATSGGIWGNGTVFAVNTNGTGFTTLHSFTAISGHWGPNSDGAGPNGLILSGNTLFGTASGGGSSGNGTVFAVNTDGTGFTTLHSFTATPNSTNSDGANPQAASILSGNTLYGTAYDGGSSGGGTVFAVKTDGTDFTTLHTFTVASPCCGFLGSTGATNSDGAGPQAGLILSGNTLYGTASGGGSSGNGTVFAVNTDGTEFRNLHSFTATDPNTSFTNSDGAYPTAGLILSGNTLYGTAYGGGTNGYGTVFSIFIQPQLTMIPSGPYMILTWPTNYSGFTLQSTTNIGSSALWSTNSSPPVVIGGENVVINTMSGRQQFFRLSQQSP